MFYSICTAIATEVIFGRDFFNLSNACLKYCHHVGWPHWRQVLSPPIGKYTTFCSTGSPTWSLYCLYLLNFSTSSGDSWLGCFLNIDWHAFMTAGWKIRLGGIDIGKFLVRLRMGAGGMYETETCLVVVNFGRAFASLEDTLDWRKLNNLFRLLNFLEGLVFL